MDFYNFYPCHQRENFSEFTSFTLSHKVTVPKGDYTERLEGLCEYEVFMNPFIWKTLNHSVVIWGEVETPNLYYGQDYTFREQKPRESRRRTKELSSVVR